MRSDMERTLCARFKPAGSTCAAVPLPVAGAWRAIIVFVAALAALGTVVPAAAATPAIAGSFREGLWEMTIRAEVPGAKPMPPIVLKKCVTAKEIQDLQAKASRPPGSDQCKVSDQRTQGNSTTWKIECTGRMKMAGEGSVTSSGDSYAMQSTMVMTAADGKVMQVSNALTGKRIGECKPGSP
jgi:hypothetical protein